MPQGRQLSFVRAVRSATSVVSVLVVVGLLPGGDLATVAGATVSGVISNGRTITYWAHPSALSGVLTAPRHGHTITTLHWLTEDGYPEVYEVLAQRVYPQTVWFKIRIPGRPNGRTGWVPDSALGRLHLVVTHLVVNERKLRLTLYRSGRRVFTTRIAVGKASTPTPAGQFWVREKFHAQGGLYGPYAFGTSDYSVLSDWPRGGVIGIHGTDTPQLIPGRVSHGCVRLINAAVTRLYPLVPVGTPITID
jgi:lipoprotein-anchoring transpeptidase ErfK/SrfK